MIQVYDAQISAPARFFMLDRQETPEVSCQGTYSTLSNFPPIYPWCCVCVVCVCAL